MRKEAEHMSKKQKNKFQRLLFAHKKQVYEASLLAEPEDAIKAKALQLYIVNQTVCSCVQHYKTTF